LPSRARAPQAPSSRGRSPSTSGRNHSMTSPPLDRRRFVRLGAAGAVAAALPGLAMADTPRKATFADGTSVPALGQGSWHMSNGRNSPEEAQDAMTLGLSLGLTLIDTSDDYGAGRSEELIAKVIAGSRDKIFLVSKLDPSEATTDEGVEKALRASLER